MQVKIVSLGVYPAQIGGVKIHTYYLAKFLAERGNSVTVLVEKKKSVPRQGKVDDFEVSALGFPFPVIGPVSVVLDGLVRLLLKKNETDVVHIQYCIYYALSALLFKVLTARPYIISCHGSDIKSTGNKRPWRLFQRVLLSRATKVTAVSKEIVSILESKYGIPRRKIELVPNGIDSTEIQKVTAFRGVKNLDRVVFIGSLRGIKDPQTALAAFSIAHSHFSESELVVIGDGPLKASLEQFARTNTLSDCIIFKGQLHHGEALLELSRCDIFLLSSRSEGFPTTLVEAMALGKTVVATNVGGVTDIIENESNGLLVPPGSPIRLGEALIRAFADKELSRRLSEAALASSRDYTWTNILEKYIGIYGSDVPLPGTKGK